jgi:hypothetical protein
MTLRLTERSWAIEVCTAISTWAVEVESTIKSAGGEHGMRDDAGALFPDVVLFGDGAQAMVIQGWELKLPDTAIDDTDLLVNAQRKAEALGLASFVVWNVNQAALYSISSDQRTLIKTWNLAIQVDRRGVASSPWKKLLFEMLEDINEFISVGEIRLTSPLDMLSSSTFGGFVTRHIESTKESIKTHCGLNAELREEVDLWWADHSHEHSASDKYLILANEILVSWLSKFLLAHAIRRTATTASRVDEISADTSVQDAQQIFYEISLASDFFNVFIQELAEKTIPRMAWVELTEINAVLRNALVQDSTSAVLQQLLNVPRAAARRSAGQFATPNVVASLMAALASLTTQDHVLDPCAGTGTIAKALFNQLRILGASPDEATKRVWASDKFRSPLRLATLALSVPENRSLILNVFQYDASQLVPGLGITLTDPNSGEKVKRDLPLFDAIVSNLPFVRREIIDHLNPGLREDVNEMLAAHEISLSSKSDLFAYLPFALFRITKPGARIVLLTSNSWMASEWGGLFIDAIERFYKIKYVVASGNGRWFTEVKVATTIIVLERRTDVVASDSIKTEMTNYSLLHDRIETLCPEDDPSASGTLSARIKSGQSIDSKLSTFSVSVKDRRLITEAGASFTTLFSDTSWTDSVLPLLRPIRDLFDVGRGERRGWDAMFYPPNENEIEAEYLIPVLLSPRSAGIESEPDGFAFCCSADEDHLKTMGHHGALRWISQFRSAVNGTGKPLPEVLMRSGYHWYEMRADAVADLVIPMNPNTRLFVSRLKTRSLANQRLITLRAHKQADLDLCHALLNSAVGVLLLEASGFGRGEGVLDLRSDNVKNRMKMLDPHRVSEQQKVTILEAFRPLRNREIKDLNHELLQLDRLNFDQVVAEVYGFEVDLQSIRNAARDLLSMRMLASRT